MTTAAIETTALTKFYGESLGILGVDLQVEQGEVFGFLGPNGAGKTTTIRLLLDLIRPTSGEAYVLGHPCQGESVAVRGRVGYLPGELALYEDLSVGEHLRHFASFHRTTHWAYVEEMAERLSCDMTRRVGELSRGNKQKVGIIQAFMARPELVILDEPTSGLDPLVQQEVHRLVREVADDGRTVFFSSHVLPEVERTCDRVGIIREGELVAVERIAELKVRAVRHFVVGFAGAVPVEELQALESVTRIEVHDDHATLTVQGAPDELVKLLAEHTITSLSTDDASLEDVFLEYYVGPEGEAMADGGAGPATGDDVTGPTTPSRGGQP